MLKPITMICMLLITVSNISHFDWLRHKNKPAEAAAITMSPANPLIEKDQNGQYLNFDINIKNISTHALYLATIEGSVMDASVKPIFRQSISLNNKATGIRSIGNTLLKPGESIDIFNPFYSLAPDVKITFLQYEFFFDYADSPQQRAGNKKRLPVDFDLSVKKIIVPRAFTPKNFYDLPLKGKVIVQDGHNPGQGSGPVGAVEQPLKIVVSKANRYAFNLASADDNGDMFNGDAFKKENWYVFGKPVYALAGGIVVALENTIPDNEFKGKIVSLPRIAPDADPYGMGNYMIIDHGNGQFSMLQHLEQGSIIVRIGELVRPGQQIGKVGFSGNSTFPHLHYMVMNGAKAQAAEGIPSYFENYKLYKGKSFSNIKQGRIDSGDIVESEK
ncbi:MAG TPA: M23 family metallopeptidase [Mucilaginibacter sp.]|jgi:murein DD-endopeptidase MepM/ murein hydrolase activator NlpD|nr:M23 family metallopeptidase [Mucilaginibacter sp.]